MSIIEQATSVSVEWLAGVLPRMLLCDGEWCVYPDEHGEPRPTLEVAAVLPELDGRAERWMA